jgi:hypothetical protein
MDKLMELAEYMVKRIKSMPDKFYLILEPELVNVCFWYVPTRLRSMPHGPEREKLLGQVSDYSSCIRIVICPYCKPGNWETFFTPPQQFSKSLLYSSQQLGLALSMVCLIRMTFRV